MDDASEILTEQVVGLMDRVAALEERVELREKVLLRHADDFR